MVRLNLGCGEKVRADFVNIDCRKLPGVDVVLDLERENLPYDNGSVDEIFLEDFLEHLSGTRQRPFLMEIRRVLKLGGKVFIKLPDLERIAKRYCGLTPGTSPQHKGDAEIMAATLYGGQDYESNFHKWGYDWHSLKTILESMDFRVIDCNSDGESNLLCWAEKWSSTDKEQFPRKEELK